MMSWFVTNYKISHPICCKIESYEELNINYKKILISIFWGTWKIWGELQENSEAFGDCLRPFFITILDLWKVQNS